MLQQTRVAAAIPYYDRFIAALPNPAALAVCEPDALRKLWQGLGYYNRVNNMQKAARIVCEQYGGDLPADYDALRSLPGIGDYTAGAVASIAFGIPSPRWTATCCGFLPGCTTTTPTSWPLPPKSLYRTGAGPDAQGHARPLQRGADGAGGAGLHPRHAPLRACPLADLCRGYAAGRADQLPVKPAPKAKGKVPVTVALIESEQGLLLQRRPARGCWPDCGSPQRGKKALTRDELTAALAGMGVQAALDEPLPPAKHVFTHKIWNSAAGRAPRLPALCRTVCLGRAGAIGRGIPRAECVRGVCEGEVRVSFSWP